MVKIDKLTSGARAMQKHGSGIAEREGSGAIAQLIQQYCPDGVEYVKLDEIGSFYSGLSGKSKEDFRDGNAKFITYVNIFNNPALNTDVEDKVKIADGEKQNTIQYGDLLFTGSSETPDECGMCSVLTHHTDEKLYLNSFCFGFRFNDLSDKNPDFMKHLFRSSSIRKVICKTANGVTRYNISKKEFAKIEIPLPPLPVQEEIVRILDNFTNLAAELQAELQARQQQYNYYRDTLLNVECRIKNVEWLPIPMFAELKAGKSIKSTELEEIKNDDHKYPCFGGNGIRGYIGKVSHSGEYAIIGRQGALCGCVNWASGDFYATEHAVVCSPLDNVISRFVYYLFATANLNQYKSQGAQPGLSVQRLNELVFPIPPLSEQQRIVSILDRFDTLTNNLSQGLPAEIEARQQQYEYYRDQLLTFKRM
ncbi:MAG: restriction endonuclease subunit S [Bacteroidales bacterium]|nr:restriction endonuclease subunit S [Bacteroidales bacterium]